jgi:hypothetical protein
MPEVTDPALLAQLNGTAGPMRGPPKPRDAYRESRDAQIDARANRSEDRANRSEERASRADARAEAAFRKPPPAVMGGYLENNTAAIKLRKAIAGLEARPGSVGLQNILGDTVNQRIDPNGVDVRGDIADIGSLKIHDRSGAAVSASESPRLTPFIPSVNDTPEAAKKKLQRLLEEVEGTQASIGEIYDLPSLDDNTQQDLGVTVDASQANNGVIINPAPNTPSPMGRDRTTALKDIVGQGDEQTSTDMQAGPVASYVTDADKAATGKMQGAFNGGASYSDLTALNEQLGGLWSDADIRNALSYRDGTGQYARQGPQRGAGFQTPSTGKQTATEKAVSSVADSPLGAYAIGAANGITMGGLDEVAGAIGGEGAGQRAQYAKEYSRENSPVASTVGEIAGMGGVAALAPAAASSVAGGAVAGGAYGALENNDNRLLGALIGAGTGGAVNKYAPAAISAVSNKVSPLVSAGVDAVSRRLPGSAGRQLARDEVAQGADIIAAGVDEDILVREVDLRPSLRDQYSGAEASRYGGPKIQKAASDDAQSIASRLAKLGGAGTPKDNFALGSGAQAAVTAEKQAMSNEVGALYRRTEMQAPGFKGQADGIAKAIDNKVAGIKSVTPEGNEAQIALLEKIKGNFQKTGVSVETLQANRGIVSRHVKDNNLAFTPEEVELIDVISKANSELEKSLSASGNGAALQTLKNANAKWAEYSDFKKSVVKDVVGTKNNPVPPETAARRLVSMVTAGGDSGKFERIYKLLPDAEKADFKALLVENVGSNSKGDFSLAYLANNLSEKKISMRSLREVLGPDDFRSLMNLKTLAKAKVAAMGGKNFSNTARAANNAPTGFGDAVRGLLGFAGGGGTGAVVAVGAPKVAEILGTRRTVKMLLNTDFRKWADNLPNTNNPKVIDRYLERLDKIKAPEVASNVIAIKDYLANGISQSPGRLAAQDENQ